MRIRTVGPVGDFEEIDPMDAHELDKIMETWVPRPKDGHPFEMHIRPGCYDLYSSLKEESLPNPKRREFDSDEILVFRDKVREEIKKEIKSFWESADWYRDKKLLHKRGLMVSGPPASGKTTILKQEINEISDNGGIVFISRSPYVLSESITALRNMEPDRQLTVVMEDIDELARGWGLHELLEMLDGASSTNHVLFIATTNDYDKLPAKLKRRGRFDHKVEVPLPGYAIRKEYFEKKIGDLLTEEEIHKFAKHTKGLNFGDLREASILAGKYEMDIKDVVKRLKEENKDDVPSEQAIYGFDCKEESYG